MAHFELFADFLANRMREPKLEAIALRVQDVHLVSMAIKKNKKHGV
ncbi:hypothetical protein ALQ89_100875 [Pseudomonas amygdali pv. tabaci]|uniref:Uncharacterized protein n=1 Tax=Pseudomonas amygdali pv. tabaci TaxID=322 RepID=A0AAX1VM32_PSEAJ|nr:hypothetical protein ALO60_102306 [Pseudomonas amygdali pv. tabaci]RML75095.1 hypothetical protein ALQ89_100875 [Pseudomonas amygdali pv. tabaci]RMR81244.1 hypothetical protein ALP77_102203 [Pseudomonas amygdali pv. tabaci]